MILTLLVALALFGAVAASLHPNPISWNVSLSNTSFDDKDIQPDISKIWEETNYTGPYAETWKPPSVVYGHSSPVIPLGHSFPSMIDDSVSCNGDPRLCGLRFDQVTLPGTHNSAA